MGKEEGDGIPLFGGAVVGTGVTGAEGFVGGEFGGVDGVVEGDGGSEGCEFGVDGCEGWVLGVEVGEGVEGGGGYVCAAVFDGKGAREAEVAFADEEDVVVGAEGDVVFLAGLDMGLGGRSSGGGCAGFGAGFLLLGGGRRGFGSFGCGEGFLLDFGEFALGFVF